ncbi:hypothetical protein [Yanshouia hominis]|uniref:Uncharacterized protein n=1 Tax=Yanshouia hominis TaxID=2763673 RepID=A0ABR7NLX8_9FIRM|nr:hypothetical protein [Yanshouia hominis]MBC8577413.1 hypothetical protein [Yanshouia hominis]
MINEWEEFCAYTGTVSYTASKKSDTTYLGRFTFATILEFEGMARILTILARGYLFHDKNGAVVPGDPCDRIAYARRALCAWCSAPEKGKTAPKDEWQFRTDFSELRAEFPELVNADGTGWFLRHVLAVADFTLTHPEKVRSTSLKNAEIIRAKFAAAWRNKVMQYQIPIFSTQTKGAWTLRFDDVLADALELGLLRREEPELPAEIREKIEAVLPKEVPARVVCTLIAYYLANKQDDCEWVVLPVTNFDAYFGDTSFSKKQLPKIPAEIVERSNSFGVSRFRVSPEYLP